MNKKGFVLVELLVYLIVITMLFTLFIPRIYSESNERTLNLMEQSFISDYYYALNVSMVEYRTVYITFYTSDHRYVLSNDRGKIYKTVSYDSSIKLNLNLKHNKIIIINGVPYSDDFIELSCGQTYIKLVVLKSGAIYKTS